MKKVQLEALQQECDAMIDASLDRLKQTHKYGIDHFSFNPRQVLKCRRLTNSMIEKCARGFQVRGMKFEFRPEYQTFALSVDLLRSCAMNPLQAKKFNAIMLDSNQSGKNL